MLKIMAMICPPTVAIAAPATPMAGMPNMPKMRMGSRMMLLTAPTSWKIMGQIILPVA